MIESRFEDDPSENARMCLALAPDHCLTCGDFHLGAIMRRSTLAPELRIADEAEFRIATVQAIETIRAKTANMRVLIVGSTDTGLYISLLNAASAAGGDDYARKLSVTLVDQCETPLEICRRYAASNGLVLDAVRSNLIDFTPEKAFQLVIMHGVLTFFPEAHRLDYMRHVRGWMAPEGRLVSSVQSGRKVGSGEPQERILHALANLQRFMDEAGIHGPEATQLRDRLVRGMEGRQDQPELFSDEEEAVSFYRHAGFRVKSLLFIANRHRKAGGLRRRYSDRSIAVCSPDVA